MDLKQSIYNLFHIANSLKESEESSSEGSRSEELSSEELSSEELSSEELSSEKSSSEESSSKESDLKSEIFNAIEAVKSHLPDKGLTREGVRKDRSDSMYNFYLKFLKQKLPGVWKVGNKHIEDLDPSQKSIVTTKDEFENEYKIWENDKLPGFS